MIATCLRAAPVALVSVLAIGLAVCGRAEAEGDAQARARGLNDQGNSAYDLRNYDEAIARFSEAYNVYPDARILFNLAQEESLFESGGLVSMGQRAQRVFGKTYGQYAAFFSPMLYRMRISPACALAPRSGEGRAPPPPGW